ncbi:hypothetical protein PAPYR_12593 [Paratrimastix pyriformis]|uniref:HEAT repeat domain-containing protein n=1 Tax=Paratrimastix pyriformis TaxID=342808 RepID=A0ABQ8U6W9_9EUKA|nr:hypothetical protein PAPYR_12593 [Paratrimastix pyriformis]
MRQRTLRRTRSLNLGMPRKGYLGLFEVPALGNVPDLLRPFVGRGRDAVMRPALPKATWVALNKAYPVQVYELHRPLAEPDRSGVDQTALRRSPLGAPEVGALLESLWLDVAMVRRVAIHALAELITADEPDPDKVQKDLQRSIQLGEASRVGLVQAVARQVLEQKVGGSIPASDEVKKPEGFPGTYGRPPRRKIEIVMGTLQ